MNNTKYVIKRNGSKAPFQVQKLKDMINFACNGLDVNPLELESKISLSMKNNIKTSEIQELMTHTCLTLISPEESDWVYVSGRLAMANLHGEVLKNSGFKYDEFDSFFKYAIKNNYYRKNITESYSFEDINALSNIIIPSKDFNKTIAQVASLKSKYLIKNKMGILEYPQFADLTSSMILASVEIDKIKWTKEFFEMIVDDYISLATPFKSNLRLENGNTGSCFILPIGDSLSQISKGWTDMSIISREGGGIGAYFGYIRPGNTYSNNVYKSNKINRWVKIVNDIALAVNQRGVRPGAITPALDWWHLDIEDFIEMKTETGGDLRDKCFDLFPQIVVDAYFVDAVLTNKEVYLFNQHELHQLTGIDIISQLDDELYNTHKLVEKLINEGKLKHYHKILAKDLWKNVLRIWFETGDFYITHKDNLNICNYLKGNSLIANSANLCVESFSISKLPTKWKIEGDAHKQNTVESDGIYHSCNLVSINVGIIFNDKLLKRVCKNAVRILDNSIETGTMPVLEAQTSADWLRNIGIGIVGGADWMAYNKLSYEKVEDIKKYEALIEKISYWCYEASIELAKEKGSYPAYEVASYNTMFGKTPQELNELSPNGFDWVVLNDRIKNEGIRNFLLLAIAPNTSTGILMGAVANYLPPQDKFNIQTLANLSVPIIPRYLKTRFWYYKSKFNYKPEVLINVTKELQRWIDTGISMEVAINTNIANMKAISDAILSGFKNKELKAVYYSLSINGEKAGCSDCAN